MNWDLKDQYTAFQQEITNKEMGAWKEGESAKNWLRAQEEPGMGEGKHES